MTKKYITVTVIMALFLSTLAGCGQTTNFLGGTSKQEKDTVRSDEVFIPIEKIRTLNPIISKDEDAYYIDKLIYESLFGFDKNLSLTDILADSYVYGQDGSSLTINLKQGIYWQDGEEFTAEDVKFTMDVITAASYVGSTLYASNISNVKYTKLSNKDPYQIMIYFNDPKNISLSAFTFPILPRHQFKNVEEAKKSEADFIPMGTGPYKVTEYNELSHIILTGNESYHGDNKPQNTLDFQVIPEKRDAINLMDVNNITITFSKEIDRDTIYTNKDVNVVNFPSNEVELIGFNFRNPVLKDSRVRKAIASAIDTEAIIESSYFKNGIQNDSIYFPNFLGVTDTQAAISYDLTIAKDYLREAGFYDRNGDGQLEDATGKTLSVNLLVNAEDQSRSAAAQIIKEGLEQLTIKTNIVSKDWNSYNADLASGNFDLFLGGYQFKENYDLRFLLHTNYGNQIGFSDPALDVLLDKMESGISQKERQTTYTEIKKTLNKDLPYFCILYKTYGAIASPTLKGTVRPTFLNLYEGAEDWYAIIEKPAEKAGDTSGTTE